MMISLNRNSPMGIKEQIKRQVQGLIQQGVLKPNEALPSARDLAVCLNVNRNTVWAAYRELVGEGFLKSVAGTGTFVSQGKAHSENIHDLILIFDEAIQRACDLGFDEEQVSNSFMNFLALRNFDPTLKKVLVVECNQETLDEMIATLQKSLGVGTKGVLIQQLEESGGLIDELAKDVDLVVSGFNHVEEFKQACPNCGLEIVGLLLKPDLAVINELLNLPKGSCVGLTCANQRSTETFFKSAVLSKGSTIKRIWAGLNETKKFKEMLAQCQVIYATHYVYDRVKALIHAGQKVRKVQLEIDQAGIDLVRSKLAALNRSVK